MPTMQLGAAVRAGNRAYEENQYAGMPPERIILALYDGVISALERAQSAIDAGEVAVRCREIGRALAIIGELHAALRPDAAPELVEALSGIYGYASREIVRANARVEKAPIAACVGLFEELRDGWAAMLRSSPAGGTPGEYL